MNGVSLLENWTKLKFPMKGMLDVIWGFPTQMSLFGKVLLAKIAHARTQTRNCQIFII